MDKFVFLDSGQSISAQYILKDCKVLPNVEYLNIRKNMRPKFLSRLMNVYLRGVKPFKWLPLEYVVDHSYAFEPEKLENGNRCFVITYDGFLWMLTDKYLKRLQDNGYIPCLLYLNSIKANCLGGGYDERLKYFKNHIYTFDQYDAARFNVQFVDSFYSKLVDANSKPEPRAGVYYIGAAKDRLSRIISFCDYFRLHDVDFNFNIMGDPCGMVCDGKVKFISSPIPYTQSVNDMLGYSTIFDITENGQHGATLRYYEAVVYNKKLVTTNHHVKELYYYNPDYMKIVDAPEELDVAWLKSQINIDYGYDGRFSPVNFLKILQQ